MGLEKRLERIDRTVNRINGLNKKSLSGKIAKGFLMIPFTWAAGALDGATQGQALEKIGIRKENAKYLTLANAIFFGLGTSAMWYFGGREAPEAAKKTAELLDVGVDIFKYGYVYWNVVQNLGRIVYVSATGKPAISLSPLGIGGSRLKKAFEYLSDRYG